MRIARLNRLATAWVATGVLCAPLACAEEPALKEPSASEKIADKFKAIAKEFLTEMMPGMPPEMVKKGEQEMKAEPGKLPEKMSDAVMTHYQAQFAIEESEAKKLLAGEFNNAKNTEQIKKALKIFAELKVDLPGPVAHIMKKFQAGEWKDLQLEFAARYFQGVLDQIKRALDKTPQEKK